MEILIGLKIGQKHQPSGICVVQEEDRGHNHFLVRHLERLPIGTKYPDVAQRVGQIAYELGQKAEERYSLQIYVDVTGLGNTLIDLVQSYVRPDNIYAVHFNYGDLRTREDSSINLGKCYLVSQLQILLQTRRLHLPDTEEAKNLAQELSDYEIHLDPKANERQGAFAVGTRDELVTALGIVVCREPRIYSAVF